MKKVLLLGGSNQQIPAIIKAKDLGYYTILCDYLEHNPGKEYADKFYCTSTVDMEAILKIAVEESIDGVLAYGSDPAAATAAYVSEALNLPGQPFESVEILTNKDKYREFLAMNNFYTPKAKGYSEIEEIKKEIKNYKFPVIIKPVDSSGSKGVSMLESVDEVEIKVQEALSYSRNKKVIIEEYVEMDGYQVAGDGFSINGELVFRCFGNDHFNTVNNLNPFIPISASFPYDMPERIHEKIHKEIQRLLYLLDMKTGAYNFDIRVDNKENIYLMEVGPRSGGNYIPQVIEYATGIDMVELNVKAAVGEITNNLKMVTPKGYWSYYAIHSLKPGVLKEIKISENVQKNNIIDIYLNYSLGDKIPAFTASNTTLGIIIMKFSSMTEMLNMMDYSDRWIEIVVE